MSSKCAFSDGEICCSAVRTALSGKWVIPQSMTCILVGDVREKLLPWRNSKWKMLTGMVYDSNVPWSCDALHDPDSSDRIGDSAASISYDDRIFHSIEWLKIADTLFHWPDESLLIFPGLTSSSNPRICSQGTRGSEQEITITPLPEARLIGPKSCIRGEGL